MFDRFDNICPDDLLEQNLIEDRMDAQDMPDDDDLPTTNSVLDKFDIILGVDTEYVSARDMPSAPQRAKDTDRNVILSYQFCGYFRLRHLTTASRHGFVAAVRSAITNELSEPIGVFRTKGSDLRHRKYLGATVVEMVRASIAGGYVPHELIPSIRQSKGGEKLTLHVAVAAHFSRAEISAFADFRKFKKSIDGVRKTYATVMHPAVIEARIPEIIGRPMVKILISVIDTTLLAPAGAGTLAALGEQLGVPKLSVPPVIDETGLQRPGIERMDLAFEQHPVETEAYSLRDAEVTLMWVLKIAEIVDLLELVKMPPTLGSLAVELAQREVATAMPNYQSDDFFGYVTSEGDNGRPRRVWHSAIADNLALACDCFHGGLNQCFAVGEYAHQTGFSDIDLCGAYTTALAMIRIPDWDAATPTLDPEVLRDWRNGMSVIRVEFTAPESERFCCLPVLEDGGKIAFGLIYPRAGASDCTAPELDLAIRRGYQVRIIEAVHYPYVPDLDTAPMAAFAHVINEWRAEFRTEAGGSSKSPGELTIKTVGNSAYGKIAQGLAQYRTIPDPQRVFNTRAGRHESLPISRISNPVIAATTTGIIRATLVEIMLAIPPEHRIISATTDGFLTTASWAEALEACSGLLATAYADARRVVDAAGNPSPIEIKATIAGVQSWKTRGAVSLPGSGVICACAGHRIPDAQFRDKEAAATAYRELYRDRTHGMTLYRSTFVSLAEQWKSNGDLVSSESMVAASLEYDLKHRPIKVHDHNGLIRFDTTPWDNIQEFLRYRNAWEKYRKNGHLLKTAADWHRFIAYLNGGIAKGSKRTAFQELVLRALTHWESSGLPEMSPIAIARLLAEAEVPGINSRRNIHDVKRRTKWQPTTAPVFPQDVYLIQTLKAVLNITEIQTLIDLGQSDPETADLCRPVQLVGRRPKF